MKKRLAHTLRGILLFGLLVIPVAAPVAAQSQSDIEKKQCRKDDDCVIVHGCFDMAFNKGYFEQNKSRFLADNVSCLKSGPHDPKAKARCISDKCYIVVPIQPHPAAKAPQQ